MKLVLAGWLLMLGAVAALPAPGERLILQLANGDRISGVVVEEDAQRLVLSNAWHPALSVDLNSVAQRWPAEAAPPAAAANEPPALPEPPATGAALATNAAVSVKKISPWRGDWQAGVDLRRGERDSALYHSRLKLAYVEGRFRHLTDLHYSYGKTDGTLSANRVEGSLKTDFDLSRSIFVYNYFDAIFDEVRKIDLRYQAGPGVGYQLLASSNLVVNLEAGAVYEDERRGDGTRSDHFSVRLAQTLQWRLAERVLVQESFDFYPRFTRMDDFRLRLEVTLKYLLNKRLSLNFSVLNNYDQTPPAGVARNDLQLRSAIGVTF